MKIETTSREDLKSAGQGCKWALDRLLLTSTDTPRDRERLAHRLEEVHDLLTAPLTGRRTRKLSVDDPVHWYFQYLFAKEFARGPEKGAIDVKVKMAETLGISVERLEKVLTEGRR